MRYVALLRGIMPMNPNMRGEKLRGAFEQLGFKNVATVIASGNVVFDSPSKNTKALESKIEKALHTTLGFKSTTIIRSEAHLKALVKRDPFKGAGHAKHTYLIVTFFKDGKKELCNAVDLTDSKTPSFMVAIEKKHGKEVTTRTWKTVGRILKKME